MTLPTTREEARQTLSSQLPKIAGCLEQGWDRWKKLLELNSEYSAIFSNRTRAGVVYDFIRYEARSVFDKTPDVTVSEERGFLLLTFYERYVLRFKKFRDTKGLSRSDEIGDRKLHTSGAATQQSLDYANQVLPGMTELTHLVAGYLLDEAGVELKHLAIACTLGDEQWVLELEVGVKEGTMISFPGEQPVEQGDTIVRPKRDAKIPGQQAPGDHELIKTRDEGQSDSAYPVARTVSEER